MNTTNTREANFNAFLEKCKPEVKDYFLSLDPNLTFSERVRLTMFFITELITQRKHQITKR